MAQKNMLPITVLMSVFNGERWLAESIQSVLEQTFSNFEFIIVNDGSTDRSLEVIKQFATKDARIRVFDKPNTGLADSLNYGIARARGEWIARIDADDISHSMRLVEQGNLASSDKSLVLVGSGLTIIDKDGNKLRDYRYPRSHKRLANRLLKNGAFFAHSSAFFKTEVVRNIGGYRMRIKRAEDLDLWLRIAEIGKVGCIEKPLVSIRRHADQISHDEGGFRQKEDAAIALSSYWIRKMNGVDPLDAQEPNYSIFRNWFLSELKKTNFYNKIKLKKQLVEYLRGGEKNAANFFSIAQPKNFSLIVEILYSKYIGSNIPMQLSRKWLDLSGTKT